MLAVHISNKYLNLEPVVAAAAAWFNREAVMISNSDDHQKGVYASTWILVGTELDSWAGRRLKELAQFSRLPGTAHFGQTITAAS